MTGRSWFLDHGPRGGTLFVPGEDVLLLAVDLPIASRRHRMEALPFAIEDRIAEPLDAVHIAIGAQLSPNRYLAAVVKHARMREWIERAEAEGFGHLPLVPDPLSLPVPSPGHWSVDVRGDRAIVRNGDGTGFATPLSLLSLAWEAAGKPICMSFGEPLPETFSALPQTPDAGVSRETPLDLCQGEYAHRRKMAIWQRAAIIACAGLAAHGAIAAADTAALRSIAADRRAETQALVAAVAPGAAASGDPAAAVADMLPAAGAAPGVFLPMLARASVAISPLAPGVTLRALSFDGALRLEMETDTPDGLDSARRALARAGLSGKLGQVVTENGRSRGVIVLGGPRA
jgi:general secretion pathway protein L